AALGRRGWLGDGGVAGRQPPTRFLLGCPSRLSAALVVQRLAPLALLLRLRLARDRDDVLELDLARVGRAAEGYGHLGALALRLDLLDGVGAPAELDAHALLDLCPG